MLYRIIVIILLLLCFSRTVQAAYFPSQNAFNSSTATSGRMFVADGRNFHSIALAGDLTSAWPGTISVATGAVTTNELTFINSSTASLGRLLVGTGKDFVSSSSLSVMPAGNVGVNTTVPAALLDIQQNSITTGFRIRGGSQPTNEIVDIYQGASGPLIISTVAGSDSDRFIYLYGADDQFGVVLRESDGTGTAAYANFYMRDAGAGDDALTINVSSVYTPSTGLTVTEGGNVGIGITNPVVKLHVGTAGTLNNVGSGDVYIQNDLEVDGVIYGTLSGVTTTILFGGSDSTGTAGTDYCAPFTDSAACTGTETGIDFYRVPVSCTLKNLYASANTTPGASGSWVVTVRKGSPGSMSDTTLTCTMSNPATFCADTTNNPTVTAGDTITVGWVESGTASNTGGHGWAFLCDR